MPTSTSKDQLYRRSQKTFGRFGWNDTDESTAIVIATVARTTAAFGRALHRADPQRHLPWAIGFHDQDPVTMLADPSRRYIDSAELALALGALDTPAARLALDLLPDDHIETSSLLVRRIRWSAKFGTCRRLGWSTVGGTELMAGLRQESRVGATGWRAGRRSVVTVGDVAERPSYCVVFDNDPTAGSPSPAPFDDLAALAGPADEAFREALRRHGIDPHR